jgi:ribosomal protein L11 methyltransferase
MTIAGSTYRIQIKVPQKVAIEDRGLDREEFFSWLWEIYTDRGLLGVHEGTLLTEEAAEQGLETESWTVDAAQAPRERDWISAQDEAQVELFFASPEQAEAARRELRALNAFAATEAVSEVFEQKNEDWDADWKKSFLNASDGVFIEPFWRILPAWVERELPAGERALKINPGAGFGTGTHETTQLCLRAIGEWALKQQLVGEKDRRGEDGKEKHGQPLAGARALDFGSGSGILAIGAALLGAEVIAVEIDELAIDNALENARINGIAIAGVGPARITYSKSLSDANGQFPVVIANILRPVLVEFAPELVKRLAPGGCLILSGLVENDVAEVDRVYSALLGSRPWVNELNEWRGLVWSGR